MSTLNLQSNIYLVNENRKDQKLLNYIGDHDFETRSLKIVMNSFDKKYGFDTNLVCEKIFNNPTKKFRKFTCSLFEDAKPDISVLNIIKILSKDLKINNDIILKYYKKNKLSRNELSAITIKNLKKLNKLYNDDRLVKLFLSNDLSFLSDTFFMMEEIEKERELDFLPKKPKSIKEIHDILARMKMKLSIPNYSLNQREDILILDNTEIADNMIIRVPKTHYDLIDLGEDLNFCIGNGYYSNEVKNGKCSIVSIYQNKKPLYGIQFNRYSISQAYGFDNEIIPNDILLKLQEALISEPKVPKDFIAISDSNWINGFKYNNKDLYIMMNNHIYVYFDVENNIYEELINSERKGRFVNQIIKPNYSYEKIN